MDKTSNEEEIRDFFNTYPIPDIIPTNTAFTTPPKLEKETKIAAVSPSDKETKGTVSRKRKRTDSNEGPMPRTVFSRHQLETLESRFREQSFLSKEERQELAEDLGLTERQVMIWFQNRRGRLKKRGPMDKAYNPAKLQEINIRRPYPFLCGVLTHGQRFQQGEYFSLYPREVQTHIQKVVTQLPQKEREQVNQITDTDKAPEQGPMHSQSQQELVSKENTTTPPPNVRVYTSNCSANVNTTTPPPNVSVYTSNCSANVNTTTPPPNVSVYTSNCSANVNTTTPPPNVSVYTSNCSANVNTTTPPPNVSVYTSNCNANVTNSYSNTSHNYPYTYYNHHYTNDLSYSYSQNNAVSVADSLKQRGQYYPTASTTSVYMQGYNQPISSNGESCHYGSNQLASSIANTFSNSCSSNQLVSSIANTSSNSCSANTNSVNSNTYPLYDQEKTTLGNVHSNYSVPTSYNYLDWFKMYPRMCNRQTPVVDNVYHNYHSGTTVPTCYQVPTDFNSCSASY